MSESRALVIQPQLTLSTWGVIQAIAPTMHQSRLFGVASVDQAAAIMIKGAELGLGLAASFEYVTVIQGRPTLSPRGALALVMASGKLDGLKLDLTAEKASCWMKRGIFEHTETMTIDDAKKAGLVKSGGAWESWPKNMLKWRVVGFCLDLLFSDITGGLKRSDEFGATVDDSGNVIEGEWSVAPDSAPNTQAQVGTPVTALDDLLGKYGPDAVLAANDGRIPTTPEEIAAVEAKLGAEAH